MKKILVDTTYFSFSKKDKSDVFKTCQSTIGFLEILTQHFETHFVVRVDDYFEVSVFKKIQVLFYKGNSLRKWQIPFRFNKTIQSLHPDYILVHGFGYAHFLIFLKFLCPRSKILLQCNGFVSRPKGLKKWIYKCSNPFIDGYLFTGIENAKEWFDAKIFEREKVFEVMEGSTYFKCNNDSPRQEKSYLWVGKLDSNKDPITILNAFDLFLIEQPSAKLTMIFHDGPLLNEVQNVISRKPRLQEAIHFKGYVEHDLLEEIYNTHQFFILGSHFEGSGYALSEAMACGCVPIVTNIPSFKFMTNNGNCGLLFSPENENDLLKQLIHSQKINYSAMQSEVVKQFEHKLSFNAIAKDVADIFQSL